MAIFAAGDLLMALLNLDLSQVAPEFGFDTIPAAWYNAMIDHSEMKPTKDGTGAYLELRYTILDGQYAGRKIFTRLNLRNANAVAQEIAFKQLSAIAHAINVLQVADSAQLHNQPMKIKVKVRKDQTGQYEDSNEISAVKNINEQVDMTPQSVSVAPAQFTPPAQAQGQISIPPVQQQFTPPAATTQQPWQQPAQQPAQQPPMQTQPAQAQQPWQQPQGQQPWQQQPAQNVQQAPAQQPVQTAQVQHPAQTMVPPWQQPAQ